MFPLGSNGLIPLLLLCSFSLYITIATQIFEALQVTTSNNIIQTKIFIRNFSHCLLLFFMNHQLSAKRAPEMKLNIDYIFYYH